MATLSLNKKQDPLNNLEDSFCFKLYSSDLRNWFHRKEIERDSIKAQFDCT